MNAFREVAPDAVIACTEEFFRRKQGRVSYTPQHGNRWQRWDFYKESNGWLPVVVGYSAWPDQRKEWRRLQLEISERLTCAGFLLFAYDGDYWGYEFFSQGRTLDQFAQDPEYAAECGYWEKADSLTGNVPLLLRHFPNLSERHLREHLAPLPHPRDRDILRQYEVRVRPEDKYIRGTGIGLLAFLEFLGLEVREKVEDDHFRLMFGDFYRSMWVWNSFYTDKDQAELEEVVNKAIAESDMIRRRSVQQSRCTEPRDDSSFQTGVHWRGACDLRR